MRNNLKIEFTNSYGVEESLQTEPPLISIVLPSHNEQDNVSVIYQAIQRNLVNTGVNSEIIFVDDGSTDDTAQAVINLHAQFENVRLIRLTRNFGHQAALIAGLNAAKGLAVIVMDADLQHPPDCLPKMIDEWRAGNFIVRMARQKTQDVSWHKKLISWLFYKFINMLSPAPIPPGVADFQLLDKIVVQEILRIKDNKPFLRGLIGWFGFKSITLEYIADKRYAGEASYTFQSSLKLGVRALVLVSRHPLRLGLYLGLLSALICISYLFFSLITLMRGLAIPGWTSLVISSLFPASVQLIVLGILGEYIGRIFDQGRNLPTFIVYPEIYLKIKSNELNHNELNHKVTSSIKVQQHSNNQFHFES